MIALISVKEEFLKMPRKVNSESLNIDRRIISRKLLSGEITEKDLQSLFKKLPDVADNVAEEIESPDEK
jgi:pantothenate kinase